MKIIFEASPEVSTIGRQPAGIILTLTGFQSLSHKVSTFFSHIAHHAVAKTTQLCRAIRIFHPTKGKMMRTTSPFIHGNRVGSAKSGFRTDTPFQSLLLLVGRKIPAQFREKIAVEDDGDAHQQSGVY